MAFSGNMQKKYGSELKIKQNTVVKAKCTLESKMNS